MKTLQSSTVVSGLPVHFEMDDNGRPVTYTRTQRELDTSMQALYAEHMHTHRKALQGKAPTVSFSLEDEDPCSPVPTTGVFLVITTTHNDA